MGGTAGAQLGPVCISMSAEFFFRNRLNMCWGVGKIHCHHLDHGRLARNGPEVAAIGQNAKKGAKAIIFHKNSQKKVKIGQVG